MSPPPSPSRPLYPPGFAGIQSVETVDDSKLEDHLHEVDEEYLEDTEFDPILEQEGIDKELARFDELKAYEAVNTQEVDLRGKTFISTRWVKVKKLDEEGRPIVRCRFVARELKAHSPWLDDLYAPSTVVSTSRVIDLLAVKHNLHTFTCDVSNAFLHVDEVEEIYVQPPREWLDRQEHQNWAWRMKKMIYGRRRAPQGWLDLAARILKAESMVQSSACPCFFKHTDKKLFL